MISNVVIANRLMPQVLGELSKLVETSEFLKNSTAMTAQNLHRNVLSLKMRVLSDRLLSNFMKFSQTAGMEAMAKELSVRAVSRLKSYTKEISKLQNEIAKVNIVKNLGSESMGFWPFSDGEAGDVEAEREAGTEMLRAYYDEAKNFSDFKHSSFDSYLSSVNSVIDDYPQFIGNLVFINKYSTSVSDAKDRLRDLATKSKGSARLQDITQSASGGGQTTNWSALVPDLVTSVASEVVDRTTYTAVRVGDTLLDTVEAVGEGATLANKMLKYWPVIAIIVGGVILYFYLPKLPSMKQLSKAAR